MIYQTGKFTKLVNYVTEDFRDALDHLNELIVASYTEWQDLIKNDPCKNIDKENQPVDYKLAELNKTWWKD